jgi:peptidoglycan/LPS O-acetylase OafA/YrhL
MLGRFFKISLLNNQFPTLNGLRTFAFLGIISGHAAFMISHVVFGISPTEMPQLGWFIHLTHGAWFTMDLFFILSGFLIGYILFHTFEKDSSRSLGKFARFWIRRGFRTFPLYYIFLFSYFYINKYVVSIDPNGYSLERLDWHEIFYLTNYPFNPGKYLVFWSWTLSLEEHFYLASPIVVFLLYKLKTHRARLTVLGSLWVSGSVLRYIAYQHEALLHPKVFPIMRVLYTPTHCRVDILVAGMIIAYLNQYFRSELLEIFRKEWVRLLSLLIPIGLFIIFVLPEANPAPVGLMIPGKEELTYVAAQTGVFFYGCLTSIAYFCLVTRGLFSTGRYSRALSHDSFLVIATLGYGAYFVHYPILHFVVRALSGIFLNPRDNYLLFWIAATGITLSGSLAVAYPMHLLIEKPFIALRNRYAP